MYPERPQSQRTLFKLLAEKRVWFNAKPRQKYEDRIEEENKVNFGNEVKLMLRYFIGSYFANKKYEPE